MFLLHKMKKLMWEDILTESGVEITGSYPEVIKALGKIRRLHSINTLTQ